MHVYFPLSSSFYRNKIYHLETVEPAFIYGKLLKDIKTIVMNDIKVSQTVFGVR